MKTRWLRALGVGYLVVQAAGIVAWWAWLHGSSGARVRFAPAGSEHALMAFAPGDLLMLGGLAVAGAVAIARGARWTGPVVWCHAGAGVYAGCWAFTLAVHEPERAQGAAMMAPVVLASVLIAVLWSRGRLGVEPRPRGWA